MPGVRAPAAVCTSYWGSSPVNHDHRTCLACAWLSFRSFHPEYEAWERKQVRFTFWPGVFSLGHHRSERTRPSQLISQEANGPVPHGPTCGRRLGGRVKDPPARQSTSAQGVDDGGSCIDSS